MQLLHGDNTLQSREALTKLLDHARSAQKTTLRLNVVELSDDLIFAQLNGTSLFGEERFVALEGLFRIRSPKKRQQILDTLASLPDDIVLWEDRALTTAQLKQLKPLNIKPGDIQHFKATSALFGGLDDLQPPPNSAQVLSIFHQSYESETAEYVFAMVARHLRALLQEKVGEIPSVPPFARQKLSRQAAKFSLQQLLALHHKLVDIEYRLKIGASPLSLQQELDLWLLNR